MMSMINLLQTLLQNVSIDLCGGDVTVPQHELDGPQVSSAFEQMCRE